MIQTYTGTVHTTGTKEDLLEITKEVTELLVDYAGCVLVEETEESSSSAHDEYVAILHVGGELYIRSRLYVDGGGAPSFFNISSGRYLNGEYVWDFTYKNEDLNGRENHNRYAQLIKVNDCVWMLRVQLFSRPTNIDYHLNVSYFCVLPIKSGISGEETYCCVGRSNARITEFPPSLPSENTYVYSNDGYVKLQFTNRVNARYNIPDGKLMLFPSLLFFAVAENNFGVPTIGGQLPYYMAVPNGVSLTPFTEFYCNGGRYVSLGNVAIRSV